MNRHNFTDADRKEYLRKLKEYWYPSDWPGSFMMHAVKCKPLFIEPGKVAFEYTVVPESMNLMGTIHGGCTATLFDTCMGFCFWVPEGEVPQMTVTSDLLITYINAARLGDELIIEANARAIRENLLFLHGQIYLKKDKTLIATAKQTLAMITPTQSIPKPLPAATSELAVVEDNFSLAKTPEDLEFEESKILDWHSWAWEKSFSYFVKQCYILTAVPGHFIYEFLVTRESANPHGFLHGGCLATLVDVCTSNTTAIEDGDPRVTVSLSISYVGTAKIGETIIIETKSPKEGKNVSYHTAKIYKKHNRVPIAIAHQTMATMELRRILQKSNL